MKLFNLIPALVICVILSGCDSETVQNYGEKNVFIELVNPSPDKVEVKIYDKGGWVEKVELDPQSAKSLKIDEGDYSILTTNLKSNEKYYFPDLRADKNELLKDTAYYMLEKNDKGEESVRFKFRPVFYSNVKTNPGRLIFDVTFDKSKVYALVNASWLYTKGDIRAEYEKFIKSGNKLMTAGYYGNKPFRVLEYTSGPYTPLPDSITTVYGIKGLVPKIYLVPDSIQKNEMGNYLVRQMLK